MMSTLGIRGRCSPVLGSLRALVGILAGVAGFGAACAQEGSEPPADLGAAGASIGEDELSNATYRGIYDTPVTLNDGEWEGEPFVPGGVSRPRVELVRDFRLAGDLDGDGSEEAVALLSESSGGSGTNGYLAVVARRGDGLVNLDTALVGDRVQIRNARLLGHRIELDVVQAGPEDAACCPSQKATRAWALGADGLQEVASEIIGVLSLADLGGVEWVLTRFGSKDPAPPEPKITLAFEGTRVSGSSGCNRYFAGVETGQAPGEIEIGPVAGTRMACPEDEMALEDRYLKALGRVVRFGFTTGRLVLTWSEDGATGILLFDSGQPGASIRSDPADRP